MEFLALFLIVIILIIAFIIRKLALYFLKKIAAFETKLNESKNPYIQAQKFRVENEKMYDEFLNWLQKNGEDLPFKKWQFNEDRKFDEQINKVLK